jgi:superoxide dismutase, Cu-Zn family
MRVSILVVSAILVVVTAEQHARVHLVGKTGANGVVDLIQMSGGVQMNGRVSGLTPGKHGFHVHQWGDIYSNGCDSTGPHLNPREVHLTTMC